MKQMFLWELFLILYCQILSYFQSLCIQAPPIDSSLKNQNEESESEGYKIYYCR